MAEKERGDLPEVTGEDDKQQDFKRNLQSALEYLHPWVEQRKKDYRFYALDQWDADDIAALQEENRPALTFDRTRPIINAVAGSEVTNRYQALYLPRDASLDDVDSKVATGASKASKWIQQVGDYEQYESLGFLDNLIGGVGCLESTKVYDEDPDGRLNLHRVPIWEMAWDPVSVEPNMVDARWVIRSKWVDEDELASLFGRKAVDDVIRLAGSQPAEALGGENSLVGGGGTITTREKTPEYSLLRPADEDDRYYEDRTRRVRLYEQQRWERRYHTRILSADVEQVDLLIQAAQSQQEMPQLDLMVDKDDAEARVEELTRSIEEINKELSGSPGGPIPMPITIDDFPVKTYFRSFHTRASMLSEEVMDTPYFTYQFLTAYEDWDESNKRYFFGLMRPMRDPQKYANKFMSQAVHLFNSNPKGALLVEDDLFDDLGEAMKEWNKSSGLIVTEKGGLSRPGKDKFKHLTSQVSLRGIESLLMSALNAVPAAAGVSEAYLVGGTQDLRRTAGSAVESVIAQNLKTQVNPFDSLRLYRKRMGRLILHYIQNDMSRKQLTRIVGEEDAQFLLSYEAGALMDEYDVVVEETPSSPNEKREVFEQMMANNFLPQLMSQGVPIPPELADFFPIPYEAAGQLKAALQGAFDLQMMGMEMQKAQMQMQMQAMQQGVPQGAPGDQPAGQGMPQPGEQEVQ